MNEKDWVGEAKSRIPVLLQCVSLEHPKSRRGRRFSYKLGLNKQEQFLVQYNLAGDQKMHCYACAEGVASDLLWVWSHIE